MTEENLPVVRREQGILPRQAQSDAQLLTLWLHGRSNHTQRAYQADAAEFMSFVDRGLHAVALGDVQGYADKLASEGLAPASQHRKMAAIKSLFAFGHRVCLFQCHGPTSSTASLRRRRPVRWGLPTGRP